MKQDGTNHIASWRAGRRAVVALLAALGAACSSGGEDDPNATAYANASVSRGGKLYDSWFATKGSAAPTGENPGYALTQGTQTGSVTWRCKECHGWDYKGATGAYGRGSHFTGVAGLQDTGNHAPEALVAVIRNGIAGEAMSSFGSQLTDADIWDLVKFLREGIIDLTPYIDDATKAPKNADPVRGKTLFDGTCVECHGDDGTKLNFGTLAEPEYVGTVAAENPWEFQHKVRVGQPGEDMPSALDAGWSMQDVMDVLSHARTLPIQ